MESQRPLPTEGIRALRRPLHDGLLQLQKAAEAVLSAEPRIALAAVERAVAFAGGQLVPQSRAEEFALYPAFDLVLGTPGALGPLIAQHQSIARMSEDLAKVATAARDAGETAPFVGYLLPLLYGLYATARVHLESEDVGVLGLLDKAIGPDEAMGIVDHMERLARRLSPPEG